MNKHEAARLHLLPMLSRYRRMSKSVQHDEQRSSLHDRWRFRYDEQCSSLHAEGLIAVPLIITMSDWCWIFIWQRQKSQEAFLLQESIHITTESFNGLRQIQLCVFFFLPFFLGHILIRYRLWTYKTVIILYRHSLILPILIQWNWI